RAPLPAGPAGGSSQPSARPPPRGYASSGSRISPGSARRKGSARRRIRTMHSHPLPRELFSRIDESPDELFYAAPRLVTHIDEAAIAAVTRLYREYFPPGGAVLDLMSSWVSHLPPEVAYRKVVGLGMNRDELAANPRLAGHRPAVRRDRPEHGRPARPGLRRCTIAPCTAAACAS